MNRDFITFRSITPAQQAQRMLRRHGLETALQRTPGYLQERGCSYCLVLRPQNTPKAVRLLEENGIGFVKLYPGEEDSL